MTTRDALSNSAARVAAFAADRASAALAFVFPQLCLLCDEPRPKNNDWLCPACLAALAHNHEMREPCRLCGLNPRVRTCTCEAHWAHPFDRIVAFFDYDDRIKSVMQQIKYQGRSRLAIELGLSCADRLARDVIDGAEAIVPVPLHFFRQLHRGYNQAEMFARGLSLGLEIPLPVLAGAVVRQRHTRTQTKLSKEKRARNLLNAFIVPAGKRAAVAGKSILLVDDVVTTGATTGACAQALIDAGAKSVRVLCLARD